MDIFTSAKRTPDDTVKKPMNYPSSEQTEQRLTLQHQQQLFHMQIYLKKLYARFDYKINRCIHACLPSATNCPQLHLCETKCRAGVEKFHGYVEERVAEMQSLLGECVANASQLPNTLDETYFCYDSYTQGFDKLKQFITEESMYYE